MWAEWHSVIYDAPQDRQVTRELETDLLWSGFFWKVTEKISRRNLQELNLIIIKEASDAANPNIFSARSMLLSFRAKLQQKFFSNEKASAQKRLRLKRSTETPSNDKDGVVDVISMLIEQA